jgi:hypothetical protein
MMPMPTNPTLYLLLNQAKQARVNALLSIYWGIVQKDNGHGQESAKMRSNGRNL